MQEIKQNKLYTPKLDIIFQVLFGEPDSQKITKDLLEKILGVKIEKVDLSKNPILRREFPKDKLGILDVIVEIDEKESCDLEMQVVENENIIKRILYYWGKLYTRNLKAGEDFGELKRTIVILIADFEVKGLEEQGYHSKWKIIEEKQRKLILTQHLEIHIIEIPKKYKKMENDKENKLKEWLSFLENPESEEVLYYMKNNENIKSAKEKLNTLSEDERVRRLAELREKAIMDEKEAKYTGYTEGRREGREEGRKQGKEATKKEIAKKMKEEKIGTEIIVEVTGLTKEDIDKL